MTATITRGMPDAVYHALPDLSRSQAADLLVSPLRYRHGLTHPKRPTKAMVLGTAVHALLLQPDRVGEIVTVAPDCDRRTTIGKAIYATWASTRDPGAEVIPADDMDRARAMADAVQAHPVAGPMMGAVVDHELTIRWSDEGIPLRARLDAVIPGVIIDIKTTRDANPRWFARASATFGYHLQAAWYLAGARAAGLDVHGFRLICVESSAPHDVVVYDVGEGMLTAGRSLMRAALHLYRECASLDSWPGYEPRIHLLEYDPYALDREQGWADDITGGDSAAEEDPF